MSYPTVVEMLRERAEAVKIAVEALGRHASIRDLNEEDRQEEMWGGGRSVVILRAHPYIWDDLGSDGQQAQHSLNNEYGKFRATIAILISGRVDQIQTRFKKADERVASFVQHDYAGGKSVPKELRDIIAAIDAMVALVSEVADPSSRIPIFVPDTNALMYSPQIEKWEFTDAPKFRLFMTPTVLSELDKLKVTGKSDGLRDKAESVIRQIKEYRRRGDLSTGVPIRKGISELVAVALEPVMSQSLPWLDPGNADDRLIASTLEIMRVYPHSPVVLVSRDINVQNKANFAKVVFEEPPEPPKAVPTT